MSRSVKSGGVVPPRQFRLDDGVMAELDSLIEMFAAETGDRETRTSVIRKLIRAEAVRRAKRKGAER